MAQITPDARRFLDKKSFAHVATVNPDGSPQVTPVWVDCEDDEILINTAEDREKPSNMRDEPRVSISVLDPDDPYARLLVQGRVVEITTEGADQHADRLAQKYLGEETYPFREEGEVRLKVRIEPQKISVEG